MNRKLQFGIRQHFRLSIAINKATAVVTLVGQERSREDWIRLSGAAYGLTKDPGVEADATNLNSHGRGKRM